VLAQVKVQSYFTTDSQSASPSWCQASRTRDQFFFLLEIFFRHLRVCYFVVPSLTRARVCNLLLLLVLASAVLLRSESRGTQDHILLSQFLRLPQPGGPGTRIYIPQEQGGPDIPPGHWVPFPSPLTTRRATEEVFYPASTREQRLLYVETRHVTPTVYLCVSYVYR
jgi:hypothetical protein